MIVAEDGTAHDGQIGIGAQHVMRENLHKVQELSKHRAVDLHRRVLGVKYDAVLIVIHIRRILHKEITAAHVHGNDAVILPRRMIHAAGIALILHAQQALGITRLRRQLGSGNRAGILLGLGQIDGNVQLAVFAGVLPLFILGDTVAADVVGILAQLVKPVRRLLGILLIQRLKGLAHLMREGREHAHQLGVKQLPRRAVIVAHAAGNRIVRQLVQRFGQTAVSRRSIIRQRVHLHDFQNTVDGKNLVFFFNQPAIDGIVHQGQNVIVSHLSPPALRRPRRG